MQLAILASRMMLGETDDTEISLTVIVQLLGNAVSDFGIAHVARRFKAVELPCNICRNLKKIMLTELKSTEIACQLFLQHVWDPLVLSGRSSFSE